MSFIEMRARFAATCKACRGPIAVGAPIRWRKGDGTYHQSPAVCAAVRSAAAAAPPAPAPAPVVTLDLRAVLADLERARAEGLQFPKARVLAPDGQRELRLAIAGPSSRTPGALQVVLGDEWIGRVLPSGEVGGALAHRTDVQATLRAIAADPETAARAYGRLMGRCSFCFAKLTDDRTGSSVEVGYGPSCAKNYGLPHRPTGRTRQLQPVPVEG
jgi:hypothetical protein